MLQQKQLEATVIRYCHNFFQPSFMLLCYLFVPDFSDNANEIAVALVCFNERKYVEACQAVYRYIENRSDVTFIGEPFPCDFIEVCQELLEEQVLTRERFVKYMYYIYFAVFIFCQLWSSHLKMIEVNDIFYEAYILFEFTCTCRMGEGAQAITQIFH